MIIIFNLMKEKHKYQIAVIAALFILVLILSIRSWDDIEECPLPYKVWAALAMGYFLIIRVIELQNIDRLLGEKRLQCIFLGIFTPTYSLWLALGIAWYYEASVSGCVS